MGGKSESKLSVDESGIASWKGTLRVEGGGFCGVRSQVSYIQDEAVVLTLLPGRARCVWRAMASVACDPK